MSFKSFIGKLPGGSSLYNASVKGAKMLGGAVGIKSGPTGIHNKHPLVKLVADAKAAGIHPLYAMGAAGAYQPSLGLSDSTYSSAGQAMGRVLSAMDPATQAQKVVDDPLTTAQIRSLNASADRDDAAASASRTDTILQLLKQNSTQSAVVGPLGPFINEPTKIPYARPGDPSTQAGPAGPPLKEVVGPFGEKWKMVDPAQGQDIVQPGVMGLESLYKNFIYDNLAPYGRALGKGYYDFDTWANKIQDNVVNSVKKYHQYFIQ